MIVCPLCEHAQAAGAECEVCGRALEPPVGGAAPVPPLDGLEPTVLPPVREADPEPLPGLEPTRVASDDALPDALPGAAIELDLEPTRAAPVEVAADPLPGLELTGDAPADPTPLPAITVCRYCRTPALPDERRCGRCGMRLPVVEGPRAADEPAVAEVRRCSCGAPVAGALCPACGARIPASLEG